MFVNELESRQQCRSSIFTVATKSCSIIFYIIENSSKMTHLMHIASYVRRSSHAQRTGPCKFSLVYVQLTLTCFLHCISQLFAYRLNSSKNLHNPMDIKLADVCVMHSCPKFYAFNCINNKVRNGTSSLLLLLINF